MKRNILLGLASGLSGWLLAQLGAIMMLLPGSPTWLIFIGMVLMPFLVGLAACALICAPNGRDFGIRAAVALLVYVPAGLLIKPAPLFVEELLKPLAKAHANLSTVYCFIGLFVGLLVALLLTVFRFLYAQRKA